jgi:hypothetical protein
MTGSRKVLLVLVALVLLADLLPVTHDQISWWWAQSRGHADDYLEYLSGWPEGRHVSEAKMAYDDCQREEIKKAEIRDASRSDPRKDAEYRRKQAKRQEGFFWKHAIATGTVESYKAYLQKFPQGDHAAEARQKMDALGNPSAQ